MAVPLHILFLAIIGEFATHQYTKITKIRPQYIAKIR